MVNVLQNSTLVVKRVPFWRKKVETSIMFLTNKKSKEVSTFRLIFVRPAAQKAQFVPRKKHMTKTLGPRDEELGHQKYAIHAIIPFNINTL